VGAVRYLLDTHALLWWLFADRRISKKASGILMDPANQILVSSASAWEIATKHRLGKLKSAAVLVQDIGGWVRKAGFEELRIDIEHAQRAGLFPQAHRDPFDRMLAAQSLIEDIPVLGRERELEPFGVRLIW